MNTRKLLCLCATLGERRRWNNRVVESMSPGLGGGLIHPNRSFVSQAMQSQIISSPHTSELRSRLCAKTLQESFGYNIATARSNRSPVLGVIPRAVSTQTLISLHTWPTSDTRGNP